MRLNAALRANLGRGASSAGGKNGAKASAANPFAALHELVSPQITNKRHGALNNIRQGVRRGSPAYGQRDATDAALNYLLGSSP